MNNDNRSNEELTTFITSSSTSEHAKKHQIHVHCLKILACCSILFVLLSFLLILITFVLVICYVALKNPPSPPPPTWLMSKTDQPVQVGHRGDSATSRENTLGSLVNASLHGATIVELDIQFSGDGVIVVAHDSYLDNFTNCRGQISTLPVANITRCMVTRGGNNNNNNSNSNNKITANSVCNISKNGERVEKEDKDNEEPTRWNTVPTLHDFLSEAKQLNMNLFIEMKNVNNKTYFLNEIKQNLDYFDYYNKSILLSFFPDLLKGIRSQNPRIYSMLLTRPDSISIYCNDPFSPKSFWWKVACLTPTLFDSITQMIAPTVAEFVGAGALGIEQHAITPHLVEHLHSNGFLVAAWTVNSQTEKTKCIDSRVDILITDCVYRFCSPRI